MTHIIEGSEHGEMDDLQNKVDEHIMEEIKHGEMADLQNKVNELIIEGSKHGEMDDLPNKQVYINGHIYHKNILL